MLGEKLGELRGQVMGQRHLPQVDGQPKMEVSFTTTGTIRGVAVTHSGTYWTVIRADGSLYGECPWQGVIMTPDGGVGTWGGAGVGKFTNQQGAVSLRGAIYFQIRSGDLTALNQVACIYEWEVDENGKATGSLWEWK
jgi:hypothetical protein